MQLLLSHVGTYHYFLCTNLAHMAEWFSAYFNVAEKVKYSNPQKGRCFFAPHKIKLALVESWNNLHLDGLHQEYTWSLAGFFDNVKGYYLKRAQMDSKWTPDTVPGVYLDSWWNPSRYMVQCNYLSFPPKFWVKICGFNIWKTLCVGLPKFGPEPQFELQTSELDQGFRFS